MLWQLLSKPLPLEKNDLAIWRVQLPLDQPIPQDQLLVDRCFYTQSWQAGLATHDGRMAEHFFCPYSSSRPSRYRQSITSHLRRTSIRSNSVYIQTPREGPFGPVWRCLKCQHQRRIYCNTRPFHRFNKNYGLSHNT